MIWWIAGLALSGTVTSPAPLRSSVAEFVAPMIVGEISLPPSSKAVAVSDKAVVNDRQFLLSYPDAGFMKQREGKPVVDMMPFSRRDHNVGAVAIFRHFRNAIRYVKVDGVFLKREPAMDADVISGRLARIVQEKAGHLHSLLVSRMDAFRINRHIRPQLSPRGVSGYPVGPERQSDSDDDAKQAGDAEYAPSPCPPRAVGGGVCGFPLGTQIGIAAILAGAAWASLFWGFRCLGSLSLIGRRQICEMVGYGFLSLCLFLLCFGVGMIGSG